MWRSGAMGSVGPVVLLVVLVDGKNVATAQRRRCSRPRTTCAPSAGALTRAWRSAAAARPPLRRAGTPPEAMLGMGAVVLMDSTEVLVVGNFRDLLVLVHEEGTLMPQGGKENHFYALGRPWGRG